MNFRTRCVAGAPWNIVASIGLIVFSIVLFRRGDAHGGWVVLAIALFGMATAVYAWWLRIRHPDPWEPL